MHNLLGMQQSDMKSINLIASRIWKFVTNTNIFTVSQIYAKSICMLYVLIVHHKSTHGPLDGLPL